MIFPAFLSFLILKNFHCCSGLRVQVLDSSDLNESTVVGIDEDGSKIQLPLEVFERAGQAGV